MLFFAHESCDISTLSHHLHHPFGFIELFQKLIHLLHRCSTSCSNSFPPAAIKNYRIYSFFRCHTSYNCFNTLECIIVYVQIFYCFSTPGIIAIRSLTLPIFFICWICVIKSLKSNWSFEILFCSFLASSESYCSCAFSTRETISPIPRILSAILSG